MAPDEIKLTLSIRKIKPQLMKLEKPKPENKNNWLKNYGYKQNKRVKP